MSSRCPVCATQNDTEAPRQYGEVEYYSCQRCGPFFLKFRSDDLSALLTKEKEGARLPKELTADLGKIAALSHWIRIWYESHRREPTLDWELVKSIIKNPRPSPPEQADNFVRWIGSNSKTFDEYVDVDKFAVQAIIGSATFDEFVFVFGHLRDKGVLQHQGGGDNIYVKARLSFLGWERYHELRRATSDNRTAFMAMQYDNKQLMSIFADVFKEAVEKTGFDLRRLVDMPQPAGLIDDDLRVKIRASRFLIADLTDGNAGAYWEAGYAEGLGKPVIYTCKKEVFEDSKSCPHFDTNHHLTILWDISNPQEAGEKLKSTIRATLPAGTLSPDPWHFSLCASSMIQEQGDAGAVPTSPIPLDCCGARGACQQSPTLHSSNFRLSRTPVISKGHTECLFYHAIGRKRKMPGVWGQRPQEPVSKSGDPAPTPRGSVTRESLAGRMPVRRRRV